MAQGASQPNATSTTHDCGWFAGRYSFRPMDAPRILLVRLSSIGDVILTTPLLRAIRARHPMAEISYLTRPPFVPLVADHPARPEVLTFDPRSETLSALAARLRARQFTHLLDLHGVTRTRLLRLLVPGRWRGYSKQRLARWLLIHTKVDRYPRPIMPEPERFFEAARDLDVVPDGRPAEIGISAAAEDEARGWLARMGFGARPLVALAPGAAHFTKRWPVEYWSQLAARITGAGREVIVLTGGDNAAAGSAIAEAGGAPAAATNGALGLQATAAVIRSAERFIGGDTGLMHLANAVGTPVVALFGPTVEQFGFMPYAADARVLVLPLTCRPCSAQGGPTCPRGDHACLRGITVQEVFEAASRPHVFTSPRPL